MKLDQRHSVRLYGHDYSREGLYFVTICTQNRVCLFGEIFNGELILNEIGNIAKECWLAIPKHYSYIELHEFVIMPNHVHGIIEIDEHVWANYHSPENESLFKSPSGTIGAIIRGFKIGVIKQIRNSLRANDNSPLQQQSTIWQRNYHEHIIRNDKSYQKIAEYIYKNPKSWLTDNYYQ